MFKFGTILVMMKFRHDKNLCLKCGKDDTEGHKCILNFIKADTRKIDNIEEHIDCDVSVCYVGLVRSSNVVAMNQLFPQFKYYDHKKKLVEMEVFNDLCKKEDLDINDIISHPIESLFCKYSEQQREKRIEEKKIKDEEEKILSDKVETESKAFPEVSQRIKTIVSYRDRKNLCINCGKSIHEGTCELDYTQSDNRSIEEKQNDDRTVITPKGKEITIIEELETKKINEEFLNQCNDTFFKLKPTIKEVAQRSFIIIDINKSETDQKIDSSYLIFMSKKYPNMIIYTIGSFEKVYTLLELNSFKQTKNIVTITNLLDQNIVNYLCGCKRYFGFPSNYATYCMLNNIKCTVFINKLDSSLPCDMIEMENSKSVDLELLKRNSLAWRV